ncbi:MAG: germination protein YpeB [Clostridia bacterium]|nr:germination protein YpeB [Clostridia bacterium]
MSNDFKNRMLLISIILLSTLCIATGYYAFSLREKYNIRNNNDYTEAFSNLVNYVNNVESYLAKAMISKSNEHAAQTLTQIWKDSGLAMVYLSRIPLKNEGLSQTAKFLNQVSDYSYSLSRKNIDGGELAEGDFDNLKSLHNYCVDLENTLNQLSEEIYSGEINWDDLNTGINTEFAQAVDNVNIFSNIDDNLNEYEGLIYDGAYSDHVNKQEKVGLTGREIDENEAKNKVKQFIGEEYIESINSNGFLENAEIPSYDFSVKLKDREENYSVMISKKGGHVVESSLDREVTEEKISQAEANEIGKAYLSDKGFKDMKETYFIKQGNVVTVNYAYNDNGIVVYPDLIKVRIALDNGEILGIETTGYLNSHQDRAYKEPAITIDEARASLNSDLEIKSENMAIIPTEWKTEIFCYEFKGSVEGKDFLVYINCETGKEEDILVILDTPGGTLTV